MLPTVAIADAVAGAVTVDITTGAGPAGVSPRTDSPFDAVARRFAEHCGSHGATSCPAGSPTAGWSPTRPRRSLIATSRTLGDSHDGFQLARGLAGLGSLPASLGYVGLVVVALHSNSVFARIRVLAPAGRMALTNYLTQSLVSTLFFYGYGAGQWGLARSWRVVFVAIVFALQVAFSHWWLARFRYGPMEWVWRAFTYRRIPAMRLSALAAVPVPG